MILCLKFLKKINKNNEFLKISDICAAPGGKTFQLLDNGYEIVSNDINKKRLNIMSDNLKRLNFKSKLISEINTAFEKYDYLIAPTAPVQPFRFGEKIDDPVTLMLLDYNTVTANLTGKPAISVPYRVVNGLPIGMQIIANSLEEKSLFQAAYALETKTTIPEVPL